jgi:hypothetical protein
MLREDIILKIEELKEQTKTYQRLLQLWDKSGLAERTGPAMRFFNARPQTAINALLREKGPQTQEQLMAELQAVESQSARNAGCITRAYRLRRH